MIERIIAICLKCGEYLEDADERNVCIELTECENCGATDWEVDFEL